MIRNINDDKGKRQLSVSKPQGNPYKKISTGDNYAEDTPITKPFLHHVYIGKPRKFHQWGIFAFEAITSLFHFFAYAYNPNYFTNLAKSKNPHRWIEYSITSTLMIGCLRMLTSCSDLHSGINVLSASIATNLLALANEHVENLFPKK